MEKKIYEIMLPTTEGLAKVDIETIKSIIDEKDIYIDVTDDPYLYNRCKVRVTKAEWDEIRFRLDLDKFELWY